MNNQFLTNYTEVTFLEKIKDNLHRCKAFYFSVSFIKKAGLILLKKDIESALERGCEGKLITSTYQNFTDIESLKTFLAFTERFDNFECHLDFESFHDVNYSTLGYHSKGYFFVFDDYVEVIVGSSNITRYALLKNIEWDLVVRENYHSSLYKQAMTEFNDKWNKTEILNLDIINRYALNINYAVERWDMDYDLSVNDIKPNYMQRKALKELNRYRAVGVGKALVVSSAGSGKTYLAAFDALNFNPKRLLYVVHEGSILKKSLETFQSVFGSDVSYGIFSGQSKDMDADFLFSTNVMMSNNLELFRRDEFEYIIIDECHHAVAQTYKNIMEYFEPEFLLGLTATPERMDNEDVFDLFDQNVPFELRLRDAIMNDLVVPFKYYGIRDTLIDYGLSAKDERKLIAQMSDGSHCEFIHEQVEKHRTEGKLKALVFCRNRTHAHMMAQAMSEYYHTASLDGRNTIGERIRAYNDLQSDSASLEMLFTVDILNEGVDIPGVNMVLFLRPTESSTVFIQQLGRGLRKYINKSFVTVLDFIGNSYKRSTQIAFALSGLSENFVMEKRLIFSLVEDDFSALGLDKYGVEIHVDDLSKEEILQYIEKENFNSFKYLEQDYKNFKKYINAKDYPKHMDYLNNDCAPDLLRFLNTKKDGKKNSSYYNFLCKVGEEDLPVFTNEQLEFANYLSEMLPIIRLYEFEIVRSLISGPKDISEVREYLKNTIETYEESRFKHALEYLKYVNRKRNELSLAVALDAPFIEYLEDLLSYGITRFKEEYEDDLGFKLWKNYRSGQVMGQLYQAPATFMKGTYTKDGCVYHFVNLKKDASVEERLNYKDKFLSSNMFQWETVADVSKTELEKLMNSKKSYLFVRKMDSENGVVMPFTYAGEGKLTNARKQVKYDQGKQKNVVTYLFDLPLDNELPEYLQYDFGLTKEQS